MTRLLARLALILGLLLVPFGAGLEAATTKPLPRLTFGASGPSGQAAITALGSDLPAVAAQYGLTPDELRQKFLSYNTLRLDTSQRSVQAPPVNSEPPLPSPAALPAARAAALDTPGGASSMPWAGNSASIPLAQTFLLHSKADSPKTIYLNFVGQTLTSEKRQVKDRNNPNLTSIVVPAFSKDADPAFSDDERRVIQEVWQRVAEAYSPFDVDVTTEVPAPGRISRDMDPVDSVFGIDVLITNRADVWLSNRRASYSYIESFFDTGDDDYKPAVVFHDGSDTVTRDLANAVVRSVGTALGLHYKGTGEVGEGTFKLYPGHGSSSVNGWAPIMGDLSSKPLRQFSQGEYPDASDAFEEGPQFNLASYQLTDEIAFLIRETSDGSNLVLRADEAGDTAATATWLPVARNAGAPSTSTGSVDGVIGPSTDIDMFYVKAGVGTLTAQVNPAAFGATADLKLWLLDKSGKVLQANDPVQNLGASVSYSITTADKYILQVSSTSEGNADGTPANSLTGYSQYGSMGSYSLSTSFVAPANNTPPSVSVTGAPLTGQGPLEVTFTATATAATGSQIVRYKWDFGHGEALETTSNTAKHTYPAGGQTYRATVTVTDDTGLTNSNGVTVTVESGTKPTADFTFTPPHPTANTVVTFDATPSLRGGSDITGWAWTIRDGTTNITRTTKTTSYTFARKGTYNVDLAVTNSLGTSPVKTLQVTVDNSPPTATFAADPVTGTSAPKAAPMDYTLNPVGSTDADGDPLTYIWTVVVPTGASPITIQNKTSATPFTQRFETPGTYTIKLQTSDGTATSAEYTRTFTVNDKPVPSFTHAAGTGLAINFDGRGSTDDGPAGELKFSWNFGDGTPATTPLALPTRSYTYANPGTYNVTLTVTDGQGASATSAPQQVLVGGPTAAFSPVSTTGSASLPVTFSAQNGGTGVSYAWKITDPSGTVFETSTLQTTPTYTFTKRGTYDVLLTVTKSGLSAEARGTVTINNSAPTASFTANAVTGPSAPKAAPMDYTFNTSTSADANGDPLTYTWKLQKLPNGTPVTIAPTATAPNNFRYNFSDAGNYNIILLASDGIATSAEYTLPITVNEAPKANIVPTRGTGLSVSFDAGGSTDDRPVGELTYAWNFGDGATASGKTAVHEFASAKPYDVVLTVTDKAGATDVKTAKIDLSPPNGKPTANFTMSASSGEAPLSVSFDGTGSTDDKGIASYAWDFGDGSSDQTSSLSTPVHVFRAAGSFPVTLTVTDASGETSSATQTVTVSAVQNQPRVSDIAVSLKTDRRGRTVARADVRVLAADGKPAKRAVVTAVWSGAYSLTRWGTTRSNGLASFRTPAVSAPGCFMVTVTSLQLGGTTYTLSPPATGQACR